MRNASSSIVVLILASTSNAQIRTPIATVPQPSTMPGPAPYNAKAVAVNPTSVAVSWDAVSGARAYTVDRTRTDDAACCIAHSGLITTPSWNDGGLEAGQEYSFAITALYFDGRIGSTEVVAATPYPALPSVRMVRDITPLPAAEGILRYTPCAQKGTGGPGPASVYPAAGTPAGAVFSFSAVPGNGMNYVIDRALEGNTTSWTFVGSTCGGPSPVVVSTDKISVHDWSGGVTPNGLYVYRITAVNSNGDAGWNSYHFSVPCVYGPVMKSTRVGSTVTISWTFGGTCYGFSGTPGPDSYTLTSEYGFTKTKNTYGWSSETLYGVPVGTHTYSMVGNYRTGGVTRTSTITVTVAY
jgi:hypothetical protein